MVVTDRLTWIQVDRQDAATEKDSVLGVIGHPLGECAGNRRRGQSSVLRSVLVPIPDRLDDDNEFLDSGTRLNAVHHVHADGDGTDDEQCTDADDKNGFGHRDRAKAGAQANR